MVAAEKVVEATVDAPRDGQHLLKLPFCATTKSNGSALSSGPHPDLGLAPKDLALVSGPDSAPRVLVSASGPDPDLDLAAASCGWVSQCGSASGSASSSGLGTSELAAQLASNFITLQKKDNLVLWSEPLFPHVARYTPSPHSPFLHKYPFSSALRTDPGNTGPPALTSSQSSQPFQEPHELLRHCPEISFTPSCSQGLRQGAEGPWRGKKWKGSPHLSKTSVRT